MQTRQPPLPSFTLAPVHTRATGRLVFNSSQHLDRRVLVLRMRCSQHSLVPRHRCRWRSGTSDGVACGSTTPRLRAPRCRHRCCCRNAAAVGWLHSHLRIHTCVFTPAHSYLRIHTSAFTPAHSHLRIHTCAPCSGLRGPCCAACAGPACRSRCRCMLGSSRDGIEAASKPSGAERLVRGLWLMRVRDLRSRALVGVGAFMQGMHICTACSHTLAAWNVLRQHHTHGGVGSTGMHGCKPMALERVRRALGAAVAH